MSMNGIRCYVAEDRETGEAIPYLRLDQATGGAGDPLRLTMSWWPSPSRRRSTAGVA